jgi:hypothetical protein
VRTWNFPVRCSTTSTGWTTTPAEAVEAFTPDARVADNGKTYNGRDEIPTWLTGEASEWTSTSTRLSLDVTDRLVVIMTWVEGHISGGIVDLRSAFAIDPTCRISALAITA